MEKNLVATCPRCNKKLIATKLNCGNCELELNGEFTLSKFSYLSADELKFVESFLAAHGNYKTIQRENGMSYPAVKKQFNKILKKLDLSSVRIDEINELDMIKVDIRPINESDSLVVNIIKEKLNEHNGATFIPLYSGDMCEIRYDSNNKGLVSPKIPLANQLIWEAFDAAVEIVIQSGGKARKGKARSGAKLGSDDLPLDSVEGYIAYKVHGVKVGATAFGPGFVIAAVLNWVEICNNERGYLTLNPTFRSLLK